MLFRKRRVTFVRNKEWDARNIRILRLMCLLASIVADLTVALDRRVPATPPASRNSPAQT